MLKQIEDILTDYSRLFVGTVQSPTKSYDFTFYKDKAVFWELGNNYNSIIALLCALRDSVRPIIISSKLSAEKKLKLRTDYPLISYFDGDKIHPVQQSRKTSVNFFIGLLTSGSTGDETIIVNNLERIDLCITNIHEAQKLEEIECTQILLPLSYSYALVNQLFWAIKYKRKIQIDENSIGLCDALLNSKKQSPDMICLVSEQVRQFKEICMIEKHQFPHVKLLNFAGSMFPFNDFDELRYIFPNARILNNYGCTEAMPRLTVKEIKSKDDINKSIGKTIGDIELKIKHNDAMNTILFKGKSVALGIFKANNSIDYFPEWVESGDTGSIIDGELFLTGRAKEMIKVNGERINLKSIEQCLSNLGFSQLIALFDEKTNSITAVTTNNLDISEKNYLDFCKKNLKKIFWPRKLYFIDTFPLNNNRKIDRLKLAEMLNNQQLKAFKFRTLNPINSI